MKSNIGPGDKMIRFALAVALLVLLSLKLVNNVVAIILLLAAFALLITAILGTCPLYSLLGIRSGKKKIR